MSEHSENGKNMLDVAIVGGGVAGTYCAWRMMTGAVHLPEMRSEHSNGPLKIRLFEASDRIGGRLLSLSPPALPGAALELGGMGYMTSHTLVKSLVEDALALNSHPLDLFGPDNLTYLRGRQLRFRDLTDASKVPYNLRPGEQSQDPKSLIFRGLTAVDPRFASAIGTQLREAIRGDTYQDRPLYEWGFWNLLAQNLSQEAIELIRDTTGYDIVSLNWNAADTIAMDINYVPDDTHHALEGGYQTLPLTLAQRFVDAGGSVDLERRLLSCDTTHDAGGSAALRLRFATGDSTRHEVVTARAVVLALPRRALELLEPSGPVFGEQHADIRGLIEAVSPVPMFKLALTYPEAWWTATGITPGGVSTTDLPLRSCYYWGADGTGQSTGPTNSNAILLVSGDVRNVEYWAGFRSGNREPLFQPAHMTRHDDAAPSSSHTEWSRYRAPMALVRDAHRQVVEMHGVDTAPEPVDAAFVDWADDPYGGGVHTWNIHVRSWEVTPRIINPRPGIPLFICGEAYSQTQGWVEGALETTEYMLQHHFGLAAPTWLRSSE